jgi:hypothetical protein
MPWRTIWAEPCALAFFSALHQWLRWSESAFEWIFGFWPLFVTSLEFRLAEENRASF